MVGVANLLLLVAVVVIPMAALWYGAAALSWGWRNFPKLTGMVVAAFTLSVLVAVLSFHHVFPGCRASVGGFVYGPC